MFTGIVKAGGVVDRKILNNPDIRLYISVDTPLPADLQIGDSVSVSGVCLTIVEIDGPVFGCDISVESLSRTTLGGWEEGKKVNLEFSMKSEDRFGGHFVSGHVDGIARLYQLSSVGRSLKMVFECDNGLSQYIIEKGSICVDGVSLTINEVAQTGAHCQFEVNIIPHTLSITTLSLMEVNDEVNIEIDQIARYIKQLLRYSNQVSA